MPHDFVFMSGRQDVPENVEVPHHIDQLPDGREVLVFGDPLRDAQFNHQQGDNPYGLEGDCGLVSCQDVLNQFGVNVSETDITGYAISHNLCAIGDSPADSGGTTADQRVEILREFNIPAHVESGKTMGDLANYVEQDRGVMISVNAGELWNDPNYVEQGQPNHEVVVTGVARDPTTGEIQGFYINDSGDGKSDEFVDVQTMQRAWENTGGECTITDITHSGTPIQS